MTNESNEAKRASQRDQLLQPTTDRGYLAELWNFARTSRKWWVIPLLLVIFALGAILALGNTALAPFIYTLF
jgi:hypothetical protein